MPSKYNKTVMAPDSSGELSHFEIDNIDQRVQGILNSSKVEPVSEDNLAFLLKELLQGIPIEIACDSLNIDYESVHQCKLNCELDKSKTSKFQRRVHEAVKQAEGQFATELIKQWHTATDRTKLDAVRSYMQVIQPKLRQSEAKRQDYEVQILLDIVKRYIEEDVYMKILDHISSLDPVKAVAAFDDRILGEAHGKLLSAGGDNRE